jgi:hypothetical protein
MDLDLELPARREKVCSIFYLQNSPVWKPSSDTTRPSTLPSRLSARLMRTGVPSSSALSRLETQLVTLGTATTAALPAGTRCIQNNIAGTIASNVDIGATTFTLDVSKFCIYNIQGHYAHYAHYAHGGWVGVMITPRLRPCIGVIFFKHHLQHPAQRRHPCDGRVCWCASDAG